MGTWRQLGRQLSHHFSAATQTMYTAYARTIRNWVHSLWLGQTGISPCAPCLLWWHAQVVPRPCLNVRPHRIQYQWHSPEDEQWEVVHYLLYCRPANSPPSQSESSASQSWTSTSDGLEQISCEWPFSSLHQDTCSRIPAHKTSSYTTHLTSSQVYIMIL